MGGATPERWIPEAERLTPAGTYGTMSGKGGPRATLHCTVSRPDQFADMHRVLTTKKAEPHLLYSFADDRLGQYFPLDKSARALMGSLAVPSGVSHNRVGTVNIQIEVVGTTDDWTGRTDWRPGPNFRAMMRAIASWGVRPEFIYRPATSSTDRGNVVRSFATMTGDAGGWKWWGHCHYPDGESHWDPGRVNLARFFAAAAATSPLEDDMFEQADRDKLAYLSLQVKNTAQLVSDKAAEDAGRDAALASAVTQIEATGGVDLAAVQAAAKAGSQEALTGPLTDALTAAVTAAVTANPQGLTRDEFEAVVRGVFFDAGTPDPVTS